MKKQKGLILLSSFVLLTSIVSCNSSSSSNQNSSSQISTSQVSKIEINGANVLEVGQTTKLVANTNVTWESSDTSKATISSSGEVKAISYGVVVFTATSVDNPSLKATHSITINEKLPSKDRLNLSISGDGITYNENTKTYLIPLGLQASVKVTTQEGYKTPSVSFSVSFLDQSISTSIVDVDKIDDTSCTLIGNGVVNGGTITANCSFDDDSSHNIKLNLDFEILDTNSLKKQEVFTKLESVNDNELDKLTKATITLKKKEQDKDEENSSYSYSLFKDATYATLNNNGTILNYYSGKKDNRYYLFSYDDSKKIDTVVSSYLVSEDETYSLQANSIFNIYNNSPVYLISGIIKTLFNSSYSLGNDFINFSNITAYGNSKFTINDNLVKVTSSFKNSTTNKSSSSYVDMELVVNFENNLIKDFSFKEELKENNQVISYYQLQSTNLTYGSKLDDNTSNNSSYLSFDNYYFSQLKLICLSGSKKDNVYDYTDTKKFGGSSGEYDLSTNTYSLPIYKSLPLKIDDGLGNSAIDQVKIEANNNQIDIPSLTNDGILLFSAKSVRIEQNDGTYKSEVQEGETTFTLTSSKNNISYSVRVKFSKVNLDSIEISDNKPTNNDFGNVYLNEYSSYFSLKAEPSDDANDYDYDIVDESNNIINELSVYQYQDGNLDGISSYSYSIIGSKVGTYRFKLRAKGTNVTTTDVFTINIIQPISKQDLIDNLVGKSFVNIGTTTKQISEFISESILRITYINTVDSSSSTTDVNIEFKDGGVYIKEEVDIGNNYLGQKFTDFEYEKICGGKIKLGQDYSSISFFVAKKEESLYRVEFTKDESSLIDYSNLNTYLNNKTYSTTTFMGLKVNTTLTFNSANSGKLIVYRYSDNNKIIEIDFNYEYSYSTYCYFNVISSSISSIDSSYQYKVVDISVVQDTNKFNIKIQNQYELSYQFEYNLTNFNK